MKRIISILAILVLAVLFILHTIESFPVLQFEIKHAEVEGAFSPDLSDQWVLKWIKKYLQRERLGM